MKLTDDFDYPNPKWETINDVDKIEITGKLPQYFRISETKNGIKWEYGYKKSLLSRLWDWIKTLNQRTKE